ncbi:hypothetical protein ACFLTS_06940 [Chloroflexota bacterium]
MDSESLIDIEEVKENVEKAECIVIYFQLLEKTLVLDPRFDAIEVPLIRIMPRADSVEERFKTLRRLRPRFPTPETITFVPWPKRVQSLKRFGVWAKILNRIEACGSLNSLVACEKAYDELLRLEEEETTSALKGDQYEPLWENKEE